MKKTEKNQLILGNYYTLEMCRKKLNKCAHIYQLGEMFGRNKRNLELLKKQEAEQIKKIEDCQSRINFMASVLKSKCQNLSETPVTKKDVKIAQTELGAMNDTLQAIHEKQSLIRHSNLAILQYQTEEQFKNEVEQAKDSYFKILINYNKLLHEINTLAGTAHAQKPNKIQKINPICLEQLLGEPCEHEQH